MKFKFRLYPSAQNISSVFYLLSVLFITMPLVLMASLVERDNGYLYYTVQFVYWEVPINYPRIFLNELGIWWIAVIILGLIKRLSARKALFFFIPFTICAGVFCFHLLIYVFPTLWFNWINPYYFIDGSGTRRSDSFAYARSYSEGLAVVYRNCWLDYAEFIDPDGKTEFEEKLPGDFQCGLAVYCQAHHAGVIDKNGDVIIPARYRTIMDFYHDRAVATYEYWDENYSNHFLYTVIDREGNELIPPSKHYIRNYDADGFARMKTDTGEVIIDMNGKFVMDAYGISRDGFNEGLAVYEDKSLKNKRNKEELDILLYPPTHEENCRFYSEDSAEITAILKNSVPPPTLPRCDCGIPYLNYRSDGTGFKDHEGKLAIKCMYADAKNFSCALAPVQCLLKKIRQKEYYGLTEDKKDALLAWGYIDQTGAEVIKPQYEEAAQFKKGYAAYSEKEYCLARVKKGKYGYIGTSGKWVISPSFDECCDFSEGYALFKKDGLWGYIDINGKTVIPAQFDEARDFSCGRALVRKKRMFPFEPFFEHTADNELKQWRWRYGR